MKKEEDVLKEFFNEMKQEDLQLRVPPFRKPKRKKGQLISLLMAIAAGLNIILFLGVLWRGARTPVATYLPEVEASVPVDEPNSLMDWQTPTDQLLINL